MNLEQELTSVLAGLPVAIRVTPRKGAYVWQWLDRSGQSATFAAAVEAALTELAGAFLAGEVIEHVTTVDDVQERSSAVQRER